MDAAFSWDNGYEREYGLIFMGKITIGDGALLTSPLITNVELF